MIERLFRTFLPAVAVAFALAACGGVKPVPPVVWNDIALADTLYVIPSSARYSTKGLVLKRTDSVRTERLRARLDSLLLPELQRLLSRTVVMAGDADDPRVLEHVHVKLEAVAFRRTLPRQILSDASDVVLMIPTFGRNMASPILPSSKVRLIVARPGRKTPRIHHKDEVDADDPAQLIFQVRKVLDRGYRG